MKNIVKSMNHVRHAGAIRKILSFFLILFVVGCNWLDVIPDNLPTVDDAFSNRANAERSLFACYSYLPDPTDFMAYPAYMTHYDELWFPSWISSPEIPSSRIASGEQNTNSPLLDYWSGRNGGTPMFQAIRNCDLFLENIHYPRDISDAERKRWIAEVTFLKAYYHFWLVTLYGPIPIIRGSLPISATPEQVRVYREPVDECINYIVELIDAAVPDLPTIIQNETDELGRITQPIALAVKAKALVWAASPLFNGNEDYKEWIDTRQKQLISDTYSRDKWVAAAEAIREAIDLCIATNHQLYRYDKLTGSTTFNMSDELVLTMHTRKGITERWNPGIVWSSMRNFGGKTSIPLTGTYLNERTNMQMQMFPALHAEDYLLPLNSLYASFKMAELFYTNNGIPIDEDPDWDYAGRYSPKTSTVDDRWCVAINQQTAGLHFNREARFYANLGFDRGFFEISNGAVDGGASFTPFLRLRKSDGSTLGGYHVKKMVAYETSASGGSTSKGYSGYNYRFPVIRLADLYLLYAEALNETGGQTPDAEVYVWIDAVRDIHGLKGVEEAWSKSKTPNRPKDKDEMRKIIQQERMIELAFEGQRFFDIRRWKLADEQWDKQPVRGWNPDGETAAEYYQVVQLREGRDFLFKDYLWPIAISDLYVNSNLVQTFGW